MDIGAIRDELRQLLGMPVEVLTPNALPDNRREQINWYAQGMHA